MRALLILVVSGIAFAQAPLPGSGNGGGGSGGTGCIPSGIAGIIQASTGAGACQGTALTDNGTTVNSTESITISGVSVLKSSVTAIQTWLMTPSSANLAAALTDETGTGSTVFANGPTLIAPILGTPASGNASNLTNLPITLTTTGSSGPATYTQSTNTLNVPQYTGASGCTPSGGAGVIQASNGSGACQNTSATDNGSNITATEPLLAPSFTGTGTNPYINFPSNIGHTFAAGDLVNVSGVLEFGASAVPVLLSSASGIQTWLITPNSANLAAAITDETGSGAAVFATSPTLVTPILGTPASGNATNLTNLPIVLTTTGSGAATYTQSTNTLNIPTPSAGGTPCTTTALSFQYNNAGAFGCFPDATFSTPHTMLFGASGILDLHSAATTGFLLPGGFSTGVVHVTTSTGAVTSSAVSLTADVSGVLTGANGGTGVANTATLTLGTSAVNLATLGTGIVKNTTTTGNFTNAAAADIYGLFTSCTGSSGLFLKDGGTCAAAGGGIVFPATVSGTTVSGGIPYLSNTTTLTSSALLSLNRILLGGGAGGAPTSDANFDDGVTTANTLTYGGTAGIAIPNGPLKVGTAPACTAGTGGAWCATEGTNLTNVAGAAGINANSTTHEFAAQTNGSALVGMLERVQPGAIRSTGLVAAVTTATLCAASAGACNTAGQYHVHVNLFQTGTACTSNATGGVSPSLTWTDGNGTAHSAQGIPMDTNASLTAVTGTMLWNTSTLGAWGSGDVNIDTNGSVIQYAIAFAQCSVSGTATYSADLAVTRIQ
jgi:hypothetical protein